MSEQLLILEDFNLKSLLGKGHRSEVRLGERGIEKFAIKCIKRTGNQHYDSQSYKSYLNEIKMISSLSHPNIISIKEYGDSYILNSDTLTKESSLYIAFTYAHGGSLRAFIERTGVFSEQLARYYFSSILEALLYLHNLGIAHRDIKPENILIDDALNIILADFDLASTVGFHKGVAGTRGYMAPEIEAKINYLAEMGDIFALGVTLFYMVTGRQPFARTHKDTNYNVFCNHKKKFWKNYEDRKSVV